MRTHTQFHRLAGRTGLALCLIIIALWFWTTPIFDSASHAISFATSSNLFQVRDGKFEWLSIPNNMHAVARQGWAHRALKANEHWTNPSALGLVTPSRVDGQVIHATFIPLWLPFLACALPTAYLFHRDRRRPTPNQCKHCNYNLTANTSGTCPECGLPSDIPKQLSTPPQTLSGTITPDTQQHSGGPQ